MGFDSVKCLDDGVMDICGEHAMVCTSRACIPATLSGPRVLWAGLHNRGDALARQGGERKDLEWFAAMSQAHRADVPILP